MLWVCAECSSAYSVGAPRCPHCSSTERRDGDVPKISQAGGATNADVALEHDEPGPEVVVLEPGPELEVPAEDASGAEESAESAPDAESAEGDEQAEPSEETAESAPGSEESAENAAPAPRRRAAKKST